MDKREILFRGKRVDNGEWVESVAFPHDNGMCTMFYQHSMDGSLEGKEVILKTVEAYTGLTDKNGMRIFEGDIVQAFYDSNHPDSPTIMQVIYNKKFACYNLLCEGCTQPDKFDFTDCQDIEVIGNIYDNPELLKGE